MTHDELLARVNDDEKFLDTYFGGKFKGQSALRAVVELHKPWFPIGVPKCAKCNVPYPCEDIQAVEKGLK